MTRIIHDGLYDWIMISIVNGWSKNNIISDYILTNNIDGIMTDIIIDGLYHWTTTSIIYDWSIINTVNDWSMTDIINDWSMTDSTMTKSWLTSVTES